ncbi:GNAT family N-acetyltransferase [Shinella sp. CPCC 100929]|uniref:GNAT family N-acetyltransferase n=1 Tax=Shinella lacus TaxID=2654216 RepID=A0ABT1RAL0_9HYPH|nr:GNAT family N-acetyltransferase [Shinella lacus]MCQ4632229.1 GNAT family N-acetyltransferase [Shinella lacus]
MDIQIRKAYRDELVDILDWAAAEGWNPGLGDAGPFWVADPEGYLVAEAEKRMVGAISLVRYGAHYAFLGFYIVHKDVRGQGVGLRLWEAAMAMAEDRIVGLDGVVAQQENYRKSGFAYAHANVRYGGRMQCTVPNDPRLTPVSPVHVPLIADYDERFNPARRETFLREWLKEQETRQSFALLQGTKVSGYGTIRACREGFKIGPLFSDTDVGADLLFRALVANVGGGRIFLDIPAPNTEAKALCVRHGLSPVFETARMYRGTMPDLPLNRIFGITTFELG